MKTIQKIQNDGSKALKITNNQNNNKRISPLSFILVMTFLHILGFLLVITGLVIGLTIGKIQFINDPNNISGSTDAVSNPLFSNPIDSAVYFPIIFGSIILSGMLVYWVIFWKIKKTVADEKRDNKFIKEKWMHYRHIMNFDKVKPSLPAKPKKRK